MISIHHPNDDPKRARIRVRVALALREVLVTEEFRDIVFEKASLSGQSVTEVIVRAAADQLLISRPHIGVFREGDRRGDE